MLIRHVLLVAALVFSLVGCSAHYQTANLSGVNSKLDRQKTVYVAVPQDGAYGSQVYTVAQDKPSLVRWQPHFQGGTEGSVQPANQQPVECFMNIGAGAGYAVVPVIAHWEHRATEWSSLPSRMTIQLFHSGRCYRRTGAKHND